MNQTQIAPSLQSQLQNLPVAYTEIDSEGILRVVNEAACRLHEMQPEDLIGHPIWEFLPPDEKAKSRAEFFRDLASDEDPPVIHRSLYTATGRYRVHQIHRRIQRDAEGNVTGVCCATFDVTEHEAALQESRQSRLWLESALISIPQAVIVTDALGFVRYINPAAERLTGWLSADLLGQQIEKGMPILRSSSRSQKPLSFRITLDEPWNGDIELLTRERQAVSVWLSASPIFDLETGYTNGVVIVLGSPKVVERSKQPDTSSNR